MVSMLMDDGTDYCAWLQYEARRRLMEDSRVSLEEEYKILHTGWIPQWNGGEESFFLGALMPVVGWVFEIIDLEDDNGPEVPGTLEYATSPVLVRGVTHVSGSDRRGWSIHTRGSKFPLGRCLYRVR